MAMLPNGVFNANDVEPANDFAPIPTGDYLAQITESVMKPTKNGDGHYLELVLQIVDGPMTGRLVWDRLNLDNPNKKAEEIANRTLSSICRAVGVMSVQDSAQLHNRPMIIRVGYREAYGQYGASNDVKGYKPAMQQPASQPAQGQQYSQPAQNSHKSAAPAGNRQPAWNL